MNMEYRVFCVKMFTLVLTSVISNAAEVSATLNRPSFYNTYTASQCFNAPGIPRLEFTECAEDEMIFVLESFHGVRQRREAVILQGRRDVPEESAHGVVPSDKQRSRALPSVDQTTLKGQCKNSRSDCLERGSVETTALLRERCVGRSKCMVTVNIRWLRSCSAFSNYQYATYQCIPREDVMDVCTQATHSVFRTGFISSPGYPTDYYRPGTHCACRLVAEANLKLLIRLADVSLQWSEGCEKDSITVNDSTEAADRQPWRTCSPNLQKLAGNYTSRGDMLEIVFQTDGKVNGRGFWLSAEALGNIETSCGPVLPDSSQPPTSPPLEEVVNTSTSEDTSTSPIDETKADILSVLSGDNFGGTPPNVSSDELMALTNITNDIIDGGSFNETADRFADQSTAQGGIVMKQKTLENIDPAVFIVTGISALAVVTLTLVFIAVCIRSRSQTQSISHMSGQWQPQHFQIATPLSRPGSSLSTVHIVDAINSWNVEQDGVGVYEDSTGRGSPSIDIIYSCDSRDRNNYETTRRVAGNPHEPTASF